MAKCKKKILIVNAGNADHSKLAYIVKRLVSELKGCGYGIEINNLCQNSEGSCTGCDMHANQVNRSCIDDEQFSTLAQKFLIADVVLFAVPVLRDTPPAILQAFLDKFSSFLSSEAILQDANGNPQKWGYIGTSSEAYELFDAMKANIEHTLETLEWDYLGGIRCLEDVPDFEILAECEVNALILSIYQTVR